VAAERDLRKDIWRAPGGELYALAWSPCSRYIAAGSLNNTCYVFEVVTQCIVAQLHSKDGFVQGVAWDPTGALLAIEYSGRTLRVWRNPAALTDSGSGGGCCGGRGGKKGGCDADSPRGGGGGDAVLRSRDMVLPAGLPAGAPAGDDGGGVSSSGGGEAGVAQQQCALRPLTHHAMFADDTKVGFFRRPAWTPDGTLLVAPCGVYKGYTASPTAASGFVTETRPTTYLFARDRLTAPLAHLPGTAHSTPSIAVRCSPVLYSLAATGGDGAGTLLVPTSSARLPGASAASSGTTVESSGAPMEVLEAARTTTHGGYDKSAVAAGAPHNGVMALPYRMLIAVATQTAVHIYDTQAALPVVTVAGMHAATITDLAWSPDGRMLFVSSYDGYVSAITFAPGALGEPLPPAALPPTCRRVYVPTYPHPPPAPTAASAAVAPSAAPPAGGRKRIAVQPVLVAGDGVASAAPANDTALAADAATSASKRLKVPPALPTAT